MHAAEHAAYAATEHMALFGRAVVALQAAAVSTAEQVTGLRAELAAHRSLTDDATAAAARDAADGRIATADDIAALRAEMDELRAAVQQKAERADMAAAQRQANLATASALDAIATAAEAMKPNAPAHAAAIAASIQAAGEATRQALRAAAHVDDLDALDAQLRSARQEAALAVAVARDEVTSTLTAALHADNERMRRDGNATTRMLACSSLTHAVCSLCRAQCNSGSPVRRRGVASQGGARRCFHACPGGGGRSRRHRACCRGGASS